MKRVYLLALCGLLTLSLTACAPQRIEKSPSTTGTATTTTTASSTTVVEETTLSDTSTSFTTESAGTEQATGKSSAKKSSTSQTTSPTTTSTTKEITTEQTTVVTTSLSTANYAAEVLRLVNVERAAVGLSPLAAGDAASHRAAAVRAAEIATSFSHTRPNGSGFYTALYEAGVQYRGAGENIAYGYDSPTAVVRGWMNSEGHRKNILSITYTHLAVCFHNYNWVQLFYIAA